MTAILSEIFFLWFKVALEIQLESSRPSTGRSLIQCCVRILKVCIYIAIWYTTIRLTTKLTYLMTAYIYYTPNSGFTASDTWFYKNKVG